MRSVSLSVVKTIIYTTALMILFAGNVMAKRAAPKEVAPIVTEKAIYSVPHFAALDKARNRERREAHENGGEGALHGAIEDLEPIQAPQNGGVVEARDPKTKELLWQVQVYKTVYKKGLERDIQDVFITSLELDKAQNLLIISDEKSRVFALNLTTKKVTQIE